MLLADVVVASNAIAQTRSRNAKRSTIADLLRRCDPGEGRLAVSFLSGSIPQGKIGVGFALLRDIRTVPAAPDTSLTLADVDGRLTEIGRLRGPGSASRRRDLLRSLFAAATVQEQEFLRGLLGGGLRQGALDGVMVEAIAVAHTVPADAVRRAAMVSGDLVEVAGRLFESGPGVLGDFRLQVLTPIQPMLAQTAESVEAALERLGTASFEVKLDGARVQVHRAGGEVAIFTRSLKVATDNLPGVTTVAQALAVVSVVLDGEAISLGLDGKPRAFQETMGSFGSGPESAGRVSPAPLSVYFFDCLHLDGTDLIDRPYRERLVALESVVPPEHRVRRLVTADTTAAQRFFEEVLAERHEGLMAKSLDDPYEAGRRGATWLKIKKAHTLDLVVLAVEWGSGRRTGKLSNLHLGARDPRTGAFVMLGKTFKGLTDEMLAWQTERFLGLETHRSGHVVHVRPEQVVEVAFDGVQASSRYRGGLALRFARVKSYRDDKTAGEADTIDEVRAIHRGDVRHYS